MADRMTLELEGLMLERLLCRALNDGAEFAHIARLTRSRMAVTASPRSIRLLAGLAEKYHIDNRITGVGGAGALIARAKARITVIAAFVTAVLLSALFLSRIWMVDIDIRRGESKPAGLEEILKDSGIVFGAAAGGIDTSLAALRIGSLEGVAHASVRREGVAMLIEIVCEEPAPGLYDPDSERDLVAICDGVVSSVNVKNGTAMVKPGDTVRRGQVLIAGAERLTKEETAPIGALGEVRALIWYEGRAQAPVTADERIYTGRTSTSVSLKTPWCTYSLTEGERYQNEETEVCTEPIGGLFIPLYIERRVSREYTTERRTKDITQLKLTLEAESTAAAEVAAAQNAPENAEIIDKWTDFSMIESDILDARTVIELECDIAAARGYLEGN